MPDIAEKLLIWC